MLSVTCSCTCCAVAPGQNVRMTITRNVNGGSSDCASRVYEMMPKIVDIAIRKTTSARCRKRPRRQIETAFLVAMVVAVAPCRSGCRCPLRAHDAKSSGCKGATTRTFSPADTVWTPCHTTRSPAFRPRVTVTVRSPYRATSTRRSSSELSDFHDPYGGLLARVEKRGGGQRERLLALCTVQPPARTPRRRSCRGGRRAWALRASSSRDRYGFADRRPATVRARGP